MRQFRISITFTHTFDRIGVFPGNPQNTISIGESSAYKTVEPQVWRAQPGVAKIAGPGHIQGKGRGGGAPTPPPTESHITAG